MAKDLIEQRTKQGIAYRLRLSRGALGYSQSEFAAKANRPEPSASAPVLTQQMRDLVGVARLAHART